MSITFNPQATRTVIEQDGVAVAYINDNGSLELVNPPVAPTGNMVTSFNQFGSSLSANGYQKLPSGLIIQWGTTTAASVTFPLVFPNECLRVIPQVTGLNSSSAFAGQYVHVASRSATGFTLGVASAPWTLEWVAIGR